MGKTSKKKHKKHRRRHSSLSSSSSDGSTKGDEQWEEVEASHHHDEIPTGATIKGPTMPTKEDLEKMEKPAEPVTFALEPLDFDALGSYRRENKQAMKKAQNTAELEAIMAERELNPNLRQKPVESNRNARTTVGDAGLEWHRRAYERCKQQAKEEQRPLNEIVSERYGSMDKLLSLINEGEQLNDDRSSSSRRRFLDPNAKDDRHHHHHHRRHDDRDRHHHRHHHHHHQEKKSWKRTTEDEGESTPKKPAIEEAEPAPEPEVKKDDELISEENLLELRKQLIRAELAGDDEMIEMLRNEIKHIDQLRGNPSSDAQPEGAAESNERKTLVLTTIDRYGVEKPVHDAHEPGRQRQHGHVTKQDRRKMKKEMRKLRDQDKDPERQGLSLTDLVEMERHSTTNLMPVLPSNRSSSSLTADRHILSSTRHLTGWSRVQALADQRKRQQAFEQCWLCIENLSKSYIFGLLDHWFLCAPPQQSLVEGHCFLVPIQHHSSRFQLDDDVLAELDTLKEQLTELFRKQHNQLPIFIETFKNPRILPHLYVECVPVPIHQANFVPMYFRKALLESESMWATNKKLLELNDHRSRTLKSVIPKGLPYFCVEFPVDRSNKKEQIHGYAHMIEERGQFPLYFGREILGGLMELDNPLLWMRPASKEAEEVVKTKCTYLKELWKKNTAQSSDN